MMMPLEHAPHKHAEDDADPDSLVGRVIANKYVIEQRLGEGATGVVYRARQISLDRKIALKVLRREFAHVSQFTARFEREAKAASRLDHPNSVRVFDYGCEADGLLYIAMEYVEGRDLATLLSETGPLGTKRIVDILTQILSALAVAHDIGILHRDLKPENVLVQPSIDEDGNATDVVKVCDFGIAKMMVGEPTGEKNGAQRQLTAGLIIGTPAYMSPEQASGLPLDARSDLYSVGLVAYQMLCARLAFDDPSPFALALKQVHDEPIAPSAFMNGIEPALEALCLRALRKLPAERFQDAREMRQALRALQSSASLSHTLTLPTVVSPRQTLPNESQDGSDVAVRFNSTTRVRPSNLASQRASDQAPTQGTTHQRHRPIFVAGVVLVAGGTAWWLSTRSADNAGRPLTSSNWAVESAGANPIPYATMFAPRLLALEAEIVAQCKPKRPIRRAGGLSGPHGSVPVEDMASSDSKSSTPAPSAAPSEKTAPGPSARAASEGTDVAQRSETQSSGQKREASPEDPAPTDIRPKTMTAAAVAVAPVVSTSAPFDVATAHVEMGPISHVDGATSSAVRRALVGIEAQITACYRSTLPTLKGAISGAATLHVESDGAGVIVTAQLSGPLGPGLNRCTAAAARARRISNVDTGSARADVQLNFKAH